MKTNLYVVEVQRVQGTHARWLDELGFRRTRADACLFRSRRLARAALVKHRKATRYRVSGKIVYVGSAVF